jgi:hypothetical protein
MKVSLPNGGKRKEVPPLPLKPEEVTEDKELKLTKFKLRTNPMQADRQSNLLLYHLETRW